MNGEEPGFIYARDGHPNARQLGERLAEIESAAWGVVCGSGMASISALLLSLTRQGDHVVASNRLYGRTSQLLMEQICNFGVQTQFVDINEPGQVGQALAGGKKRLLLVETLSNPMLRIADVPALAKLARAHDCLLIVDNTFATPVLCRPLEDGADFVMESLTKMIGGHSDVTLGVVCGGKPEDAVKEKKGPSTLDPVRASIEQTVSIWGLASNPFDCWLAERGLDTLELRTRAACDNAMSLAEWLAVQPGIGRVI